MASLLDCCNRALGAIAAGSISSLDDGSIEARECARYAPALMSEIATWSEWGWARVSVQLAPVANDRFSEWSYAYALPSDMAQVLTIHRPQDPNDIGKWRPEAGNFPFPEQAATTLAFLIEGPVLYTNVENAWLRYVQATSDVGLYPPMLARAFELELAARIALPLRKDPQLADVLSQRARIATAQAEADDINQHPRPKAIYTSDAEFARMGLSDFA